MAPFSLPIPRCGICHHRTRGRCASVNKILDVVCGCQHKPPIFKAYGILNIADGILFFPSSSFLFLIHLHHIRYSCTRLFRHICFYGNETTVFSRIAPFNKQFMQWCWAAGCWLLLPIGLGWLVLPLAGFESVLFLLRVHERCASRLIC